MFKVSVNIMLLIYHKVKKTVQFSSVQSLSSVQLFPTPWTAARQASLSISNSWSIPKLMSIESMMTSNHFILCSSLLLLPSIFPSIRVFSNESALHIRWPKYWSFNFNISPSNEHPGLISFRMELLLIKMIMTNTEHATYFVRANIYLLINFTIKLIIKLHKLILNSTYIQFWFYSFS